MAIVGLLPTSKERGGRYPSVFGSASRICTVFRALRLGLRRKVWFWTVDSWVSNRVRDVGTKKSNSPS